MKNLYDIVEELLYWYQKNARALPWREQPSAYGVWVSEIMLQQTRVEAVKQYYIRFMKELPTVSHLSEVSDEKLLKLWEGLGYYNRAKNLKKAAIDIMQNYNGEIPSSYKELLKLSGIGEYTAGAISSIAFHKAEPAVDGNVMRVMTRLYADDSNIMKKEVKKKYADSIRQVLKNTEPSVFNQAIMELGAIVCLPNGKPKCEICPIQKHCEAYKQNNVAEFPHKTPKKQKKIEQRVIFFILCQNKLALHKRAEKGLLSNLWELPNVLQQQYPFEQLKKWGFKNTQIKHMGKAKHIFTHIVWEMEGYVVKTDSFENSGDFVWVTQEQLQKQYALPSAFGEYIKKGWDMFEFFRRN